MLAVLNIKNLALVDDLTWELGDGLVGVTGTTGAGKSMIVGALKLILGERANHELVRTGAKACTVEAVFELDANLDQVNALLEESGLDPCEDNSLVLKRSFGSGNKQFVNCSPCTLSVLKAIGTLLVDLHGPHEHQSLLSRDRQLAMLDAHAGAGPEREAYREAHRAWQEALREREEFRGLGQATDQEIDLLRYQVEEIADAALDPAEIDELESRYRQAQNASRLSGSAATAVSEIQRAVQSLAEAGKQIRELEKLDPGASEVTEGFESARMEIEEMESALAGYASGLEFDSAEVVEMEHRIDQIETLKRKYGQSIGEVLAYLAQARKRLDRIDGREEEMARLDERVDSARKLVEKRGAVLGKKRAEAAPRLASEIAAHLADLGFRQSVFEIALEPCDEPRASGLESIDFLFGPNPGEAVKPLRVIASSGEMSRVMLAVKSALADQDRIPLMVFDEIDANVGGEIAGAVGEKMAYLGERHQVVAITHMPQVAARAHHHYFVAKEVVGDATISTLVPIAGEKRVAELARMLGGVGAESEALASRMLAEAG